MGGISRDMDALCEDIAAAHADRKRGIKDLKKNRKELIKNVSSMREDFRKKEEKIRSDLAEASRIWRKMNETLKAKKKKRGELK